MFLLIEMMGKSGFLVSQVGEDPLNFIDEVKKIFGLMQVNGNGRVKLASYQLKDVTHLWYTQWNDPGVTFTFVNLIRSQFLC